MTQVFLIVDDSKFARLLIRSCLERVMPGLDVLEAASGEEALTLLDSRPALDYGTIDHTMPGMKGLDLATHVRCRFPAARLALITANIQDQLRRRSEEAGVVFIGKPITDQKLSAFLQGDVVP